MRRLFITATLLSLYGAVSVAMAAEETPGAVATRKKLEVKAKIDVNNEFLSEIAAELSEAIESSGKTKVGFTYDSVGGVSKNQRVTLKSAGPITKILNDICDKQGLGWYVVSKPKDRYDGWVIFTKGKERGYAAGTEPKK